MTLTNYRTMILCSSPIDYFLKKKKQFQELFKNFIEHFQLVFIFWTYVQTIIFTQNMS